MSYIVDISSYETVRIIGFQYVPRYTIWALPKIPTSKLPDAYFQDIGPMASSTNG